MKRKILILVVALILPLLVVGLALASDGVERPRWVLSGGASDATGNGRVALRATLGQPVVGAVTNGGGDVTLAQGFWHGAKLGHAIYLPLTLRNDQP